MVGKKASCKVTAHLMWAKIKSNLNTYTNKHIINNIYKQEYWLLRTKRLERQDIMNFFFLNICLMLDLLTVSICFMGIPGGSAVNNLPLMQEMQVQSLGREDPLEKEMATHFSIPAWKSHGQRSLAGYSSWGCKELDTTEQLNNNNMAFTDILV